jgi:hypothetical protein
MLDDVSIHADHIESTVPSGTATGCFAWHDIFRCCVTVNCAIA